MKTNKSIQQRLMLGLGSLLLACSAALPLQAQANNPSNVSVTQVAEVEEAVTAADGKAEVRRVPAARVEPGKVVVYTTKLHNQGKDAATQLSLVSPVPAHTTLVGNGAFGEAAPLYSVDQGKTYAPLAQLVVEKDGRKRPARLSDVTHLRWQPQKPLAPGATLELGFKVQVN